jgi:hypothetical protein
VHGVEEVLEPIEGRFAFQLHKRGASFGSGILPSHRDGSDGFGKVAYLDE